MPGSSAKYATNNHGIGPIAPLNFDADGSTTSKTFHGLTIVVDNNIVGRIQSWEPKMYSRDGDWVYELNWLTYGRPVDYVPGINKEYTLSCTRTEVWNEELELALGYPAVWSDLIDQNRPFSVTEYVMRGSQVNRAITYTGCWFTKKNATSMDADKNPKIMMNAEIAFVGRTVIQVG